MARYRIVEPKIAVVPEGKANAGTKYLVAKLQNMLCIWEDPQTFTSFNTLMVKAFEPLLSIAHGGTAQQDAVIPDELSIISGCWVNYTPAQKFHKQHLSGHAAQPATPTRAAKPAIRAGELVGKNGQPTVFTTLAVFCQYYLDEFNEKQWVRGCSPDEAGARAFQAYCIPVKEDATPQTVEQQLPQPETVGGQTIQPINPTQQQPQQQSPQFTQVPGGAPTY